MMQKVTKSSPPVKRHPEPVPIAHSVRYDPDAFHTRMALIQALIPIGMAAVTEELQAEVESLCGKRYTRKEKDIALRRWGAQKGSVYLGDQKTPITVPRVRDVKTNEEVPLRSYQMLQEPASMDEKLFLCVLSGLATRRYDACARMVPEVFGLSSSSVSRRFIRASSAKLIAFQERPLDKLDIVAIYIDGKTFADEQMLIALGVTLDGEKIPLGFEQTATENERVTAQFLRKLVERGLVINKGLLVIMDGSKGLYAAVNKVFKGLVVIQRCQWHKRQNVLSYLPKSRRSHFKRKLKNAYDRPTYKEAKAALLSIKKQLERINLSAANSLAEGMEETLTIHRLGMFAYLKFCFRTTNCIESLNSQVADRTRNVKRWTTAGQRHRWLAAALIDAEPRLRVVKGYHYLPVLREAIQNDLNIAQEAESA